MENKISLETRRLILDELMLLGSICGQLEVPEFVKRVYPKIDTMGSTDRRFKSAEDDIRQHMVFNNDWNMEYLLYSYLDIDHIPDEDFLFFLEQYVNPVIRRFRIDDDFVREYFDNSECVDVINKYLPTDGYKLSPLENIGDKTIYKAISIQGGVRGYVKNIIFAATYKPEISFVDALNNDIIITANEDKCLIYDLDIPKDGLSWSNMVNWYCQKNNIDTNREEAYLNRLFSSLDSEPEKMLLQTYHELLHELRVDLPALIPQVYLYYDPQTLKQRGWKLFEHQKMDFLMIFSMSHRVVIEIDGKQHYAEGNVASPKLYADMVSAQREMSLYGYDVFRFGGYEFCGQPDVVSKKLKDFLIRLMNKYGLLL